MMNLKHSHSETLYNGENQARNQKCIQNFVIKVVTYASN